MDFFPEPAVLSAEDRRDVSLLAALRTVLDALASNDFAAAFGNSSVQADYHRVNMSRVVPAAGSTRETFVP